MIRIYEHLRLKDIITDSTYLTKKVNPDYITTRHEAWSPQSSWSIDYDAFETKIALRVFDRYKYNEAICYAYDENADEDKIDELKDIAKRAFCSKFSDITSNNLNRFTYLWNVVMDKYYEDYVKDIETTTTSSSDNTTSQSTNESKLNTGTVTTNTDNDVLTQNNLSQATTGTEKTDTTSGTSVDGGNYTDRTKVNDTPNAAGNYTADTYMSEYREVSHELTEKQKTEVEGSTTLTHNTTVANTGNVTVDNDTDTTVTNNLTESTTNTSSGSNNTETSQNTKITGELINKFFQYKEGIDEPSVFERIMDSYKDLFGGIIYE